MAIWIFVGFVCVVAGVVTAIALFAGGEARRPEVASPEWLVPSPVEMRAVRFPLTWRGYDPAHVDVYLDAVSAAYEALYIAARPAAIAQARERLASRFGRDVDLPGAGASAAGASAEGASGAGTSDREEDAAST